MPRSLLLSVHSAFICIFLTASQAVAQTTHHVDNLGDCAASTPCHPTIMDAIEAASPFDVIEVFPGVYHETVVFRPYPQGKDNIVLKARVKALMPVIAAPADPTPPYTRGVTMYAQGVQVLNFVIERGVSGIGPGGSGAVIQGNRITSGGIGLMYCGFSTVKDNWILDGGIGLSRSSGHCVIEGNTVVGGIGINGWDDGIQGHVVRRNTVRGGITLSGEVYQNTVESNQVEAGSIVLSEKYVDGNIVRHNVVRGGGIELSIGYPSFVLGSNTVEANFVSGSPGDGIAVSARGGSCLIRKNTSVENAGCDINDSALSGYPQNKWWNNRFETTCGTASQAGVTLREAPSP